MEINNQHKLTPQFISECKKFAAHVKRYHHALMNEDSDNWQQLISNIETLPIRENHYSSGELYLIFTRVIRARMIFHMCRRRRDKDFSFESESHKTITVGDFFYNFINVYLEEIKCFHTNVFEEMQELANDCIKFAGHILTGLGIWDDIDGNPAFEPHVFSSILYSYWQIFDPKFDKLKIKMEQK